MRSTLLLIKVITIIMVVSFFSCQNKKEIYEAPDFPVEKRLTSHIITDSALIAYSYGMCVDDQNIYILSLVDNNWIQAYDKQTGMLAGNGVRQGQGPGEVVMGISFYFDRESHLFNVYDQSQMRMNTYRFDREKQSFLFVDSKSFSDYKGVVRRAWPLEKEAYLIDGQLGKDTVGLKRFQLFSKGDILSEYNRFPVSETEKNPVFITASASLSPDKRKMAVGTLFGGILEFFQLSDDINISSTRYFYPLEVNFSGGSLLPTDQTVYGFSALCATDDLLYSVLIADKDPNQFNKICSFDWKGNEIAKYQTDCLVFNLCASDTDTNRLYAIAISQEKGFYLVRFDLE